VSQPTAIISVNVINPLKEREEAEIGLYLL
jgi:hypothetical protein